MAPDPRAVEGLVSPAQPNTDDRIVRPLAERGRDVSCESQQSTAEDGAIPPFMGSNPKARFGSNGQVRTLLREWSVMAHRSRAAYVGSQAVTARSWLIGNAC